MAPRQGDGRLLELSEELHSCGPLHSAPLVKATRNKATGNGSILVRTPTASLRMVTKGHYCTGSAQPSQQLWNPHLPHTT